MRCVHLLYQVYRLILRHWKNLEKDIKIPLSTFPVITENLSYLLRYPRPRKSLINVTKHNLSTIYKILFQTNHSSTKMGRALINRLFPPLWILYIYSKSKLIWKMKENDYIWKKSLQSRFLDLWLYFLISTFESAFIRSKKQAKHWKSSFFNKLLSTINLPLLWTKKVLNAIYCCHYKTQHP